MKGFWCSIFLAMLAASTADAAVWQPPADGEQVTLWPENARLASPDAKGEERAGPAQSLVAGRPWTKVENVVRPTLTVFRPKGSNNGTAIVVFPGGGYNVLAIDLEGTEICDWLTQNGITCAVLKYRVPGSGPHWDAACNCAKTPREPMALQDAQRAIVLLRSRAKEWDVDPTKVGVIGFSAGGHLSADVSNQAKLRYAAIDAADKENVRPDFSLVLYPGHMWDGTHLDRIKYGLRVSEKTPPTFIVQAQDDPVDDVHESIVYYLALLNANVSTEFHLYPRGGHGFGLRRTDASITRWPALAETWMRSIGVLPK